MTDQLRMYRVKPGEMDDFVHEWSTLVAPLRRKFGFTILGAWRGSGDQADRFVWLIRHDGFAQADRAYYGSPERAALQPDPARHLAHIETLLLDSIS